MALRLAKREANCSSSRLLIGEVSLGAFETPGVTVSPIAPSLYYTAYNVAALLPGAVTEGTGTAAGSWPPKTRRIVRPTSSRIMYAVGTSTSVISVANSTPNPSETAIGTMKEASRLLFHISGARPKKVVSDVSRIGRKR